MKCPVDSVDLVMSERSGVEIDYCPQCRGVWLDRGELDKIIDRAAEGFGASAPSPPAAPPAAAPTPPGHIPPPLYAPEPRRDDRRPDDRPFDDRRHDERRDRPRYEQPRYDDRRRPKKKEGWLGELFDF
jgi:Zn-finger nucleic acid-binding protein